MEEEKFENELKSARQKSIFYSHTVYFLFFQTFYDSSCTGTYGFDQSVNFSSPDIMVIHLFYNSK